MLNESERSIVHYPPVKQHQESATLFLERVNNSRVQTLNALLFDMSVSKVPFHELLQFLETTYEDLGAEECLRTIEADFLDLTDQYSGKNGVAVLQKLFLEGFAAYVSAVAETRKAIPETAQKRIRTTDDVFRARLDEFSDQVIDVLKVYLVHLKEKRPDFSGSVDLTDSYPLSLMQKMGLGTRWRRILSHANELIYTKILKLKGRYRVDDGVTPLVKLFSLSEDYEMINRYVTDAYLRTLHSLYYQIQVALREELPVDLGNGNSNSEQADQN